MIPDAIDCSPLDLTFTQAPNALLRDPKISAKAKAILVTLLSKKDGIWHDYFSQLQEFAKEGITALRSGVAELEENGYLRRIKYREKVSKRMAGVIWAYTDTPGKFNYDRQLEILRAKGYEADL